MHTDGDVDYRLVVWRKQRYLTPLNGGSGIQRRGLAYSNTYEMAFL
jgi:hypothetical protein